MATDGKTGYVSIGNYYEHLIRSGALAPGMRLDTESELAKQHGVTRTTIRRAFALLVNKGLVTKTQGRGTFVASAEDVQERLQSPVLIAPYRTISGPAEKDSIAPQQVRHRFGYLEGIVHALSAYARPFQIHYIEDDPVELKRFTEMARRKAFAGVVAFGIGVERTVSAIAALGMPAVFMDSVTFDMPVNAVLAADREGTREATQYLLTTTGGPLAFVGSPSAMWESGPNHDRLLGFNDALRDAGQEPPEANVHIVEYIDTQSGRAAARWAAGLDPQPKGIVCSTDFLAVGVLDELRNMHVAVPADISVIGFGNDCTFIATVPTLSTVAVDRTRMSREAVELLESRLHKPDTPPATIHVRTQLLLRQSTLPILGGAAL